MGAQTEVRQAVNRRFVPVAEAQGFVVDRRLQPTSIEFRRWRQDVVHVFGIQWEKYGRPRFVVPFGTCPVDGLWVGGVRHPPETVLPGWLPQAGLLQPGRGVTSRAWFRQDERWFRRLAGKPPLRPASEVVDELLAYFPELERYWSDGTVGPHMRLLRS